MISACSRPITPDVRVKGRFSGVGVRTPVVVTSVLVAVAAATFALVQLQERSIAAHDAESRLTSLRLDLVQMRDIPWGALPSEGADPAEIRGELVAMERGVEGSILSLRRDPGLPGHERILAPYRRMTDALWRIFAAAQKNDRPTAGEAAGEAAGAGHAADAALVQAASRYRAQSRGAIMQARVGSIGVILLLFLGFAWFFVRAARRRRVAEGLVAENQRLLVESRHEAVTDALTGLANRRALIADLESAEPRHEGEQVLLALFDLDGFKQYNDNFGHPAGDALLSRLAERLASTIAGLGKAYRMGGDEFCILVSTDPDSAPAIAGLAASALADSGEGFVIGCSYGVALLPSEATRPAAALLLADQRMYDNKRSGRVSPTRQSAAVLLKLLEERSSELGQHTSEVAELAERTAARLGVAEEERARIRLAAELHDVGKAAIPDAILNKPGPLDEEEWEFVRRHTVIGERIVRAAPALAHAADLIRWHHERHDGSGYPDALAGAAIPQGAQIIAVSDAFDAMVTDRPYRSARSAPEAIAELIRCAGSQFDPQVVAAFVDQVSESRASSARHVA